MGSDMCAMVSNFMSASVPIEIERTEQESDDEKISAVLDKVREDENRKNREEKEETRKKRREKEDQGRTGIQGAPNQIRKSSTAIVRPEEAVEQSMLSSAAASASGKKICTSTRRSHRGRPENESSNAL